MTAICPACHWTGSSAQVRDGVRYLQAAEKELSMPDLFGSLEAAA